MVISTEFPFVAFYKLYTEKIIIGCNNYKFQIKIFKKIWNLFIFLQKHHFEQLNRNEQNRTALNFPALRACNVTLSQNCKNPALTAWKILLEVMHALRAGFFFPWCSRLDRNSSCSRLNKNCTFIY